MNLRGWFRGLRWWAKGLIGVPALLLTLVLLYVAGRSVQFAVAEREAGLYLPPGGNVVVRLADLEHHLERLHDSAAWRVLQKRILKDPAVRSAINGGLKGWQLPTLDELEDERRGDEFSLDLVLRAAGRDAVAALQVGDSWSLVKGVACTRLRWSDYLLAPLGRLALPSEVIDDTRVLRLSLGKTELFIAFVGRLALVGTDRGLLAQALRRQGTESSKDHPVTVRMEFGTSRAMGDLRRSLRDSGVLNQVRWDSVKALEIVPDLEGAAARLEVDLEGAEPTRSEQAPPHALLRFAPSGATGAFLSATGVQDLFEWLRLQVRTKGPADPVARNIKDALDALDEVGFSAEVLPHLEGGMLVLTGTEEGEADGRLYPALAFVIPSKEPERAVDALSRLVKARGGMMAEKNFRSHPAGDSLLWSFRWPEGAQVNDFFRPCFAAVPGAFIFGNNFKFTSALLRDAGSEGAAGGVPARKLREHGVVPEPGLAGGYLLLPALRESLDGPLPQVAKFVVDASVSRVQFRAQLDAELRQEGRRLAEPEIVKLFNDRIAAMERDKEDELRAGLHVLDFMKWAAFSLHPGGKGAVLRAALEFK